MGRVKFLQPVRRLPWPFLLLIFAMASTASCAGTTSTPVTPSIPAFEPAPTAKKVARENRWGIYSLDLASSDTALLYSSPEKISNLNLNKAGDTLVFSRRLKADSDSSEEIFGFRIADGRLDRLTDNDFRDIYPVWSPDGKRIAFLSWRERDLDIHVMDAGGQEQKKLFDSGSHDADIDWSGEKIAFTSRSRVWTINDDGTGLTQVTEPPRAGVWGKANLPFGDYDPRFSPDGREIAFERLESDTSTHGCYNIYLSETTGSSEKSLTNTGYSQGMVSWSHSGWKMVFTVAAIGSEGRYDIYTMNPDGADITNVTPDYFPPDFLCHTPVFSADDDSLFFIGEWWEQ
ncbi:MAG: hypothetical protein A2Z29_07355 [Chloroflexi bacterium RBG_16_56_11]|nr:MAG: hypothetical protein A2Z29_07355 [Chloroflexi bacterium RBG_16_56_11]